MRTRCGRSSPRPPTRRATLRRTSPTSKRRSPPTRRAWPSSATWCAITGLPWCAPIWAMCRTTRPRPCSRVIATLKNARFEVETDQGQRHQGRHQDRPQGRRGDGRFHRHQRADRRHVQRARADHPRLRALRVPHAGRRGHSAQRRLPPADQDRRAERLDAEAAISGAGRGRQCGDEPDHRELPLWRARRTRLGARHHEQSHLRQRALPILRDDLLRRAGGARLRRRGCGADAYDQFAADRPGGARAPLSGAAGAVRDRARLGRQRRMARRRRNAARDPLPGRDGVRDPVRLPQSAAVRRPKAASRGRPARIG